MNALVTITAIVAAYNAESDSFTLQANDGIKFEVKAKHIPLEALELEPVNAIGRSVDCSGKVLKGAHTKAANAAKKANEAANNEAANVQAKLVAALQSRIDNAPNANFADTMRTELQQFEKKAALHALETLQALEVDMSALINRLAVSNKDDKANYIGIYVVQKIRKAAFALSQKSVAAFDKYTNSIVRNLVSLQALDMLNAQRSICSKIEIDEMQIAQQVKVYHNCSPSTASTQTSSTRMMLEALNICTVRKGAKGDTISFTDSASANAIKALYA